MYIILFSSFYLHFMFCVSEWYIVGTKKGFISYFKKSDLDKKKALRRKPALPQ